MRIFALLIVAAIVCYSSLLLLFVLIPRLAGEWTMRRGGVNLIVLCLVCHAGSALAQEVITGGATVIDDTPRLERFH